MAKRYRVGSIFAQLGLDSAQFAKDGDTALKRQQKFIKKFQSNWTPLQTSTVSLNQGIELLSKGFNLLNNSIQRAREVEGVAAGFKKLSGGLNESRVIMESLKAATGETVSEFELMKAANQAVQANIPIQQFIQLSEAARVVGNTVGRDALSSINDFTLGMTRQSIQILDNLQVFVKADEAYSRFAEANKIVGRELTETERKAAFQAEAIRQLNEKAASAADIQQTAAIATDQLASAYSDALDELSMFISKSKTLGETISGIIPSIKEFTFFIRAMGDDNGREGIIVQVGKLTKQLNDIEEDLGRRRSVFEKYLFGDNDELKSKADELRSQIKDLTGEFVKQTREIEIGAKGQKDDAEQTDKNTKSKKELEKELKKTQQAYESLTESIRDLKRETQVENLNKQIEKSLETGNKATFDELRQQLVTATKEGAIEGLDASVQNTSAAQEYADLIGQKLQEELDTRYTEAMTEAHRESVAQWQSFFENAITGVKFDLEDMLKQVAVGFASELAASLTAGVGGIDFTSPQGLGSSIAQQIFGSGGGGMGSLFGGGGGGIGSLFGGGAAANIGPVANGAQYASSLGGGSGLLAAAGPWAAIAGMGAVWAKDFVDNDGIKAITGKGNSQSNIDAALALNPFTFGLNPAMNALGMDSVGSFFGGGSPSNPETLARIAALEAVNETIKATGGLNFINERGDQVQVNKFSAAGIESRFNKEGSGEEFLSKFGKDIGLTFTSLGDVLAKKLGIEEGIGGQLGIILGEQLEGSLEGAKALFDSMGISLEDTTSALMEMGKTGELSWLAVESGINKANVALQDGRAATGDITGAFMQFQKAGGKGQDALNGITNTIIEAREAGVNDFETLRMKLLETFDPVLVDSFFKSLEDRGFKEFDQILGASERELGSIVAGVDAAIQDAGSSFDALNGKVQDTVDTMRDIPSEIGTNIEIRVRTTMDGLSKELTGINSSSSESSGGGSIPALASGGIVTRPTLSLIGEGNEPEIVAPLSKMKQFLARGGSVQGPGGGSTNVSINIDARGAEEGVDRRLHAMMFDFKDVVVAEALAAFTERRDR